MKMAMTISPQMVKGWWERVDELLLIARSHIYHLCLGQYSKGYPREATGFSYLLQLCDHRVRTKVQAKVHRHILVLCGNL